jgi:Carboxypeptidase regulatory-like domain
MKAIRDFFSIFFAVVLLSGVSALADQITGTVTNKTNGKPAAGDTVVLVDVQAGMAEVAHATTDAKGHYTLNKPGSGPYLVRVTHQGAGYFIAAPEGNGPGDIPVYDSAPKVNGISIEADVLELEADSGQLKVNERYFVHNTSAPPRTEYNAHDLEIVVPPDAVIDGAAARRPTGLPTSTQLTPASQKGHYTFDFPIQPDEGDKDTLFQVTYHLPYSGSKFTFKPQLTLPADNVAVLLPKSMTFEAGTGLMFQPVNEDPHILTYVAKNAVPGKPIEFTVSGTGSMPREGQGQAGGDNGGQDTAAASGQPGGGIGNPIDTPDPLSKYKWWILAAFALLLAAAAAFLLRKPAGATAGGPGMQTGATIPVGPPITEASAAAQVFASPAAKNTALLDVLKEELFAIESEKLSGKMTLDEYNEIKPALEIVLKRALNKK